MTTKHTPGPWEIRPNYSLLQSEIAVHGRALATVWTKRHGQGKDDRNQQIIEPFEEGEANARLIAAAPELLAALEILLESGTLNAGSRAIARAAIAKATNP